LVVADLLDGRTSTRSGSTPQASVTAACADRSSDAATLQAVIDRSAVGDEIVIAGPCLITHTIVLRGGRGYRGESVATTLTQAPGANLSAVLASDAWVDDTPHTGEPITLRDLTVDGNKDRNSSGSGDGVVIRSWNTQLENLYIRDTRGDGLLIAGTSRGGVALGAGSTQVQGTIRGVDVSNAGGNGIHAQDDGNAVTDWNLLDSFVGGTGKSAIRLENAGGWHVSGNHVYDCGESGIWADRTYFTSIDDNLVEDFGRDGNGIRVSVQNGAPSVLNRNRVYQANADGGSTFVAVLGVTAGTGVLTVSDNVIRGVGTGTGLQYDEAPGTLRVTSTGNNVSDVATPVAGVAPQPTY
ncbi:MAG: hypothetical protein JWO46_3082, partial [Nocardioidaceae bacterium]|nr:hypothetical protein [Nocardioidaceae bacterium]